MEYIGIDYHKQDSYVWSLNMDTGEIRQGRTVNTLDGFLRFMADPATAQVVTEAGRTWGALYDLLGAHVGRFILAHPLQVRAIAAARIKTDRIDARKLAELLAADLIPEAHLRDRVNRDRQNILRQRGFWVATQTRIKNRIHVLIDRQPAAVGAPLAGLKDIFGKVGMQWLRQTQELPPADRRLLDQMLQGLDLVRACIAQSDAQVDQVYQADADAQFLETIPGVGKFFAVLLSTEIHGIARFPSGNHLAAYTGLIPSTYASGTTVRHGRVTKQGNKWLRWGYVEAAHRAKHLNAQLAGYYTRLQHRIGKQKATVAVARRLIHISYTMLRDRRPFVVYHQPRQTDVLSRVAFTRS